MNIGKFIQDQILGMKWLQALIGQLLERLGEIFKWLGCGGCL